MADIRKKCKAYIVCDADGCEETNPSSRCGTCQMVYYCSPDCQRKHWKVHKADCMPIDRMRERIAGIGSQSLTPIEPDPETVKKVLQDSPSECSICFESPISKPIVLAGCHHVFCFACIKQWNDSQTNPMKNFAGPQANAPTELNMRTTPQSPSCPLCREAMPDVSETPMKNALNIIAAAGMKRKAAPEECKELCDKALDQIKLLAEEEINGSLSFQEQIQIAVIQGEAAMFCENYESAIHIYQRASTRLEAAVERNKEITTLMDQAAKIKDDPDREEECGNLLDRVMAVNAQGHCGPNEHIHMMLKLGQAQRLAEKWSDAKANYQDLAMRYMQTYDSMTPQQIRETFTSMSECAYHLGHNDKAISLGEGAIEMNRQFPWSHKFVALAQKASGDVEAAKQTAAQAVVYESPWDDKHKAEVERWYQEHFC